MAQQLAASTPYLSYYLYCQSLENDLWAIARSTIITDNKQQPTSLSSCLQQYYYESEAATDIQLAVALSSDSKIQLAVHRNLVTPPPTTRTPHLAITSRPFLLRHRAQPKPLSSPSPPPAATLSSAQQIPTPPLSPQAQCPAGRPNPGAAAAPGRRPRLHIPLIRSADRGKNMRERWIQKRVNPRGRKKKKSKPHSGPNFSCTFT
jgi:hypothetical protein